MEQKRNRKGDLRGGSIRGAVGKIVGVAVKARVNDRRGMVRRGVVGRTAVGVAATERVKERKKDQMILEKYDK